MDLPLCFALVTAFAIALYVLADGFDLGVGILFLLAPRDEDRDLMMESISPLWDGNETWLVFGGTLLLAAFPIGYSVLLPAFYLPIMLMLFSLIFRGIAFEFRFQAGRFRRLWDFAFAGGSVLAAVCQGLILGGFIAGVPVENGGFSGGPFGFLTILGVLCSAGLVGGYALLGSGWLIWKTSGPTQTFGREVGHSALLLTVALMAVVSAWTALAEPEVAQRWFALPQSLPLALLPIGAVAVSVGLWRSLWGRQEALPFVLGIVLFLFGFGGLAASLWPYVVPRTATIWMGAADEATLRFIGVGVVVILPIVLAYLGHAYWIFRGKTAIGHGYGEGAEAPIGASWRRRRSPSLETDLYLS
jgi:cytochrome bd ubiquinol oxidase subunit II